MTNEELLDALIAIVDDGSGRPPLEMARDRLARPEAALKTLPDEPTEAMCKAGAAHEWSGGYDRQGSHASGKYEEYTESLRYAFGDHSSPFAAGEVYMAMVKAFREGK